VFVLEVAVDEPVAPRAQRLPHHLNGMVDVCGPLERPL
jgi:hypothetical protein